MPVTDSLRPHAASLLTLAAGSAAWVAPTAMAAPGAPIGPPIVVANAVGAATVARAGNGRMVVSYLRAGTLTARRYSADGTPQGAPSVVATSLERGSSGGAAMDADGDYVVAWARPDDRRTLIQAQRYAADGTAQGAVIDVDTLLTPTTVIGSVVRIEQGLSRLTVDMNADGEFALLYGDMQVSLIGNRAACKYLIGSVCTGSARETLRLRRYDAAGLPMGPASQVTTVVEPNVEVAGLAFLSAGRLITGADVEMRANGSTLAAWSTFGRVGAVQRGRLYTRAYGVNGVAGLAREIGSASNAYRSDVELDSSADGSHVLVHASDTTDRITGQTDRAIELDLLASDGSPLRPRTRVDLGSDSFRSAPTVSMDAAGNHVVAFREVGGLVAQRYATGGSALAGLFNVTAPGVSGFNPVLACDAVGNFVIGYTMNNGDFVLQLHEGP